MRGHTSLTGAARYARLSQRLPCHVQRRAIQISAVPTTETPVIGEDPLSAIDASSTADARFEVIGSPYSMLSVSLSASQKLYTRRGTLVGVSGKVENAQSTLSILSPARRAALGIPFLYQRISSATPITALISTKSPITSMSVIHLNGTVDWMVTQRSALLAWTGHTLSVKPRVNRAMSLAHWGNSQITGRGLVALAGPGQVYKITLGPGESYVAHPANVVAYTIASNPPLPYRFKSHSFALQIPDLGVQKYLMGIKFFRTMVTTTSWKTVSNFLYNLRTAARRTIWGDRLFLQFQGPTTLLMSSRASRISDTLTTRDINEIADAPSGALLKTVTLPKEQVEVADASSVVKNKPTGFKVASVQGGQAKIEEAKSLNEFKN